MSLPGITAPSGTPVFLATGHMVQERGRHETISFGTGHSRTRAVRTALERVVSVEWILEEQVAAQVYDWLEETLKAATEEFAAQVASQDGPGLLWWRSRWLEMPTWEIMHLGRKRMTGWLFLTGEGSAEGPDTSSMAVEFLDRLMAGPLRIPAGALMSIEFSDGLTLINSLRLEFSDGLVAREPGEPVETESGGLVTTETGLQVETEQP